MKGTATASDSKPTSTPLPTSLDDTSDSSTSSGLSPGAKGRLEAGVIVAFLPLLFGFLLGCRYLRRRPGDVPVETEPETVNKPGFAELDTKVGHMGIMPNAKDDQHIAELNSGPIRDEYSARLSELDGTKAPGELPAFESIPRQGETPTIGCSDEPIRR